MPVEKTSDTKDWIFRGILTVLVSATLVTTMGAFKLLKELAPIVKQNTKDINTVNAKVDVQALDMSNHKDWEIQEHTRIWERFANERQLQTIR